jgi:hypothetical protein
MNIDGFSRKLLSATLAVSFALAALGASCTAAASGDTFAQPQRVREYKLQVSHKTLAAANADIARDDIASLSRDADLGAYWKQGFSWAQAQNALNAYPQYLGRVDGIDLPFYYVAAESHKAPVLLLTQSTPGSIVGLLANVDALTHPSRHGGNANDAVSVVIAALPGSSFSALAHPATSDATTARMWNELMTDVIGARRYRVHGEGVGAGAMAEMQRLYPQTISVSALGSVAPASHDALLTDLLLSRLDQDRMECNLRLTANAQTGVDAGFWPEAISNPIVLAKMKVEISAVEGAAKTDKGAAQ